MIASGLCLSLTIQIYSAVSVANAGNICRLKFSGKSDICNETKLQKTN